MIYLKLESAKKQVDRSEEKKNPSGKKIHAPVTATPYVPV